MLTYICWTIICKKIIFEISILHRHVNTVERNLPRCKEHTHFHLVSSSLWDLKEWIHDVYLWIIDIKTVWNNSRHLDSWWLKLFFVFVFFNHWIFINEQFEHSGLFDLFLLVISLRCQACALHLHYPADPEGVSSYGKLAGVVRLLFQNKRHISTFYWAEEGISSKMKPEGKIQKVKK